MNFIGKHNAQPMTHDARRTTHDERRATSDKRRVFGLYAIADSNHDPFSDLTLLVEKYLEGGCRLVQIRMKGSPPDEVLKTSLKLAKFRSRYDFVLIINDHADVAAKVEAQGVHVGEFDTKIEDIKGRYGEGLIVGYSSHSIDEAIEAQRRGADYVAFGAIFPTKTKGPGHPVQGIEKLRKLKSCLDIPLVAIGGIGRDNIKAVAETGVDAVAMISSLAEADDIVEETRWFTGQIAPLGKIRNSKLETRNKLEIRNSKSKHSTS